MDVAPPILPEYDPEISRIADYVCNANFSSVDAYSSAYWCLLDALACSFLAHRYAECEHLMGPMTNGEIVEDGARVPGTHFELTPVLAAFNIGTAIRWLDFNDTWLAQEWGHPSDNLGGLLAVADFESRLRIEQGGQPFTIMDLLTAMIKAYEVQGVIALENSFNRVGLDHVILVKIATAAVVTHMLGGTFDQVRNAISQAFIDGHPLRVYRHAPNTGSRKSWAAGDATSRGVWLAQIVMRGEAGYPNALTAKTWGFYDVYFNGKPLSFSQDFDTYVIENILFKVGFPAEFHGQTAVEAAIQLHPEVLDRMTDIEKITIRTTESAMRIINKVGELHNPADRDHCLQYMVACGLIWGEIKPDHYHDYKFIRDSRIDDLRNLMQVTEDEQFSKDYLDPEKRSIANAVQVFFKDGSSTKEILIEYPLGHKKRRQEAYPELMKKFRGSVMTHFPPEQYEKIYKVIDDLIHTKDMPVNQFVDLFVKKGSATR